MNLSDYESQALKTMADQTEIHERISSGDIDTVQLLIGVLGLADEVGELVAQVKGNVEYGRELDYTNLKEEVGDCLWRLAQICDACDFLMKDCAQANIRKLSKRYKGGYTQKAAQEENRDRKAEWETISQTGQGWAEPLEMDEDTTL